MKFHLATLFPLSVISSALAHGAVTTPTLGAVSSTTSGVISVLLLNVLLSRYIDAADLAACGSIVNTILTADQYGPVTYSVSKNLANCIYAPPRLRTRPSVPDQPTYNATACHLFFCRGYQFEDNVDNTRVYAPGTMCTSSST
ncbi:hypothetical protein C8R47DRAFT_1091562 [Mycena vitilis]|nr:hypothetical protein C8R47DRAFT_1091562 [Mycena vitilis]